MDQNNLITTQQAAKRLHVSRNTISRLVRAAELRAVKKTAAANSPFLIDAESVEAFLIRRQTESSQATEK